MFRTKGIRSNINTRLFLKLFGNVIENLLINIFTTQMRITVSGFYFDHIITNFQYRDVESTSTEIKDSDLFIFLFIKSISESGGGWFVDNAFNIKTCNLTSIFGSFSLSIIEISRHSNNSFSNLFSQLSFSIYFKLLQNHGGNFFRTIFFISHFNHDRTIFSRKNFKRHSGLILLDSRIRESVADKAFDTENSIFGVSHSLALSQKTHQTIACFRNSYHRRSSAYTFSIFYNFWLTCFHDRKSGVSGAEIYSNDFSHDV